MNRRQTVINLLATRTSATRERLEFMSTDDLETALEQSLLKGIRAEVLNTPEVVKRYQEIDAINADRQRMAQEQQLSNIFRVPINGKVAIDNFANRDLIRSWVDETKDEAITPAWFVQILRESPALAQSLSWTSADILDPAKRKQLEANQEAIDRDTFNRFASENNFSQCESNYLLAKSVIGDHLARHLLVGAVESNALNLAPASPDELASFRQDAIAVHNQKILNMDIPSLRKLAREAGARGQAAPPPDETQRVRAIENHDRSYPLLPDELRIGDREELIDAAYIRRCPKEVLKSLIHKYGAPQIDEALRTRSPQTSPLW